MIAFNKSIIIIKVLFYGTILHLLSQFILLFNESFINISKVQLGDIVIPKIARNLFYENEDIRITTFITIPTHQDHNNGNILNIQENYYNSNATTTTTTTTTTNAASLETANDTDQSNNDNKSIKEIKHEINKRIALWTGETIRISNNNNSVLVVANNNNNKKLNLGHINTIEIAISYCEDDFSLWIINILKDLKLPKRINIRITILSKCNNERTISEHLQEQVNNHKLNVQIETVNILNKGGHHLAFVHFINRYIENESLETAASSILLFLKDTQHHQGRGKYYRTIEDMVYFTTNGEFICGRKQSLECSVFHQTPKLYGFHIPQYYIRHGDNHKKLNNITQYRTLGEFVHREFNWKFPNDLVTEVCYGGSFGMPALRLFFDPELEKDFKNLEKILINGMSIIEYYTERLWASFFATPLSVEETNTVLACSEGTIGLKFYMYRGLLVSHSRKCFNVNDVANNIEFEANLRSSKDYNDKAIALWTGEALRSNNSINENNMVVVTNHQNNKISKLDHINTIEIAMAYCTSDFSSWIINTLKRQKLPKRIKIKITILSKCNNENTMLQLLQKKSIENNITVNIETVSLINKGGCDLAFVHFINTYINRQSRETAASSIILFLKDTPRIQETNHQGGYYRTIQDMIYFASNGEFICGIKDKYKQRSVYHDTQILKEFHMSEYKRFGDQKRSNPDKFTANYKSLGDYVEKEMDWQFPNDKVTEVCYGGSFGLPASRLFVNPVLEKDFQHIEETLINGPEMSVVEHYLERLWASFLARPLNANESKIVLACSEGTMEPEYFMFRGRLISHSMKCHNQRIK